MRREIEIVAHNVFFVVVLVVVAAAAVAVAI
jgi:hypothetical protein